MVAARPVTVPQDGHHRKGELRRDAFTERVFCFAVRNALLRKVMTRRVTATYHHT